MSKFFKKSLAVMTTAAILASSSAIVSYAAAASVTWDDANITKVEKWSTDDEAYVSCASGDKAAKIKITVAEGFIPYVAVDGGKPTEVTADAEGNFVVENTNDTAVVITAVKKQTGGAGGGATGQPDAKEIEKDSTVWVNGKDVKARKGSTDPSYFYKTETYQATGMYAGGKWAVQVTPAQIDGKDVDLATFLSKFDEKGKFDKDLAKAAKDLASAKIKDGKVTVTAGKKAGEIRVWVYEINSKKVAVDATSIDGATINETTGAVTWPAAIKGAVHIADVEPMDKTFTVKMASSSPAFMTEKDFSDTSNFDATTKVLTKEGAKKAVSKATFLYKDGAEAQEAVTYVIVDKKAVIDAEAHWDIDKTGKNAFDAKVVSAELKDGKLTITPVGAGKTNVVVKNYESGKTVKFAVTVSKAFKVTVGEGVKITYKDETKKEKTVTGGADVEAWILEKTAVKVDVDADVSGTEVKAGKTFKVDKAAAVTKKAAAATTTQYTVTISGAGEGDSVQAGGKDVATGAKLDKDTEITVTAGSGRTVTVKQGETDVTVTENKFKLAGDVTITFAANA